MIHAFCLHSRIYANLHDRTYAHHHMYIIIISSFYVKLISYVADLHVLNSTKELTALL